MTEPGTKEYAEQYEAFADGVWAVNDEATDEDVEHLWAIRQRDRALMELRR